MSRLPSTFTVGADDTDAIMQIHNQMFPKIVKEWAMPEPPRQQESATAIPVIDSIFAPRSLDEYVGQQEAKELASIMVHAAIKERRTLPNAMVVGEYGLGKTTLATLIMREYGAPVRLLDGASINRSIPTGLVIIDEIHNIQPETADTLNIHIDNNTIQIIGCTTDPGQLPSAFRSRFRTFYLKPYTIDELTYILDGIVKRKGVAATKQVLYWIAERSRFNARQATIYLSFIFDLMTVKGQRTITGPLVHEAFDKLGVDKLGFASRDKVYLDSLPEDRPVGLQYLSARTGIDEKTLEEEIEPYLLRMGMIDRTQRGRLKLKVLAEDYSHGTGYR